MVQRVVISHFFNEAYLLPWWLKHHREIFDHGVLIDYASTDESVAICKELVPHWEVVPSENASFAAILCDFEVMKHESRFPNAWKLALNTTEFFVAPGLEKMERLLVQHDLTGVRLPGAVMVDIDPNTPPDPARSLVEQKSAGIWENEIDFKGLAIPGLTFPTRSRLGGTPRNCRASATAAATSARSAGMGSAHGATPSRRGSCKFRIGATRSMSRTGSAPSIRQTLPSSIAVGRSSRHSAAF
jgi:hypothetical protein